MLRRHPLYPLSYVRVYRGAVNTPILIGFCNLLTILPHHPNHVKPYSDAGVGVWYMGGPAQSTRNPPQTLVGSTVTKNGVPTRVGTDKDGKRRPASLCPTLLRSNANAITNPTTVTKIEDFKRLSICCVIPLFSSMITVYHILKYRVKCQFGRWASNPHGFLHTILSRACLPITPLPNKRGANTPSNQSIFSTSRIIPRLDRACQPPP